jgi:flagellar hook-length control protein FliK
VAPAPAATVAATAADGEPAPATDPHPAAGRSIPLTIVSAALPPTTPTAPPQPVQPPAPARNFAEPIRAEPIRPEPIRPEPPSAALVEASANPPRPEIASGRRGREPERLVTWLRPPAAGAVVEALPQRSRVRSVEPTAASAAALPPETRCAANVRAATFTLAPLAGDARALQPLDPQRDPFSPTIATAVADAGAAPPPAAPAIPSATALPASQPPAAVSTAEPAAVAQAGVDVAAPRWQETLASRIQFMVDHDVGEARLKLNPPELGALDVKIAVHDDRTYVQLAAASAAARDELTQSLPRLRELLSLGGLNLGGATVSDGGHGQPHAAEARVSSALAAAADAMLETVPRAQPLRRPTGIDLYA